MYLSEKQMELVFKWKDRGFQIDESKSPEGHLKIYAIKGNQVVLLLVITEEEDIENYREMIRSRDE